jgi:energy-coupling factor transporter transmembrane protein EcfT
MMFETTTFGHLWILVIVIVAWIPAILALVYTLRSRSITSVEKIAWIVLLVFLPLIGIILWLSIRPVKDPVIRNQEQRFPNTEI